MNDHAARVLLIEDNPITRKLVRLALSGVGYTVLEAGDGAAARELLRAELPDLVLQDLVLPDVSGFQLLQEIRDLPGGRDIPVLAFTGFLPRDDEARAAAAGFTEFLVKPIEPSRLIETVRGYVPPVRTEDRHRSRGKRILLVEDDAVQRKLARLHLEHAGFQVETAEDGKEALQAARQRPPDAILSDILMPRLDGFRLCRAVRQDPQLRAIPIVLQSHQYVDEADRTLALRLGANAYLARTPDLRAATDALTAAIAAPAPPIGDAEIHEPYSEYLDRVVKQLERQAIRNAELSQQNAMQAAALAVLGATADALAQRHSIDSILDDTLYRCIDAAGLSVGVFYLAQGDGFSARTVVGYRATAGSPVHTAFGHPELLRRALALGDAIPLPPEEPDDAASDFLTALGFRAALLTPVAFGEERLGVLLFASNAREAVAREWVGFARVIAAQVGQAMALSRSFDRLRLSEERYRQLFQSTPLPLWMFDLETHAILSANDAAVALYGHSPEEFLALRAEDLRPPDQVEKWRAYLRTLPLGLHSAGIWRHRKKDGTTIAVDIITHSIVLEGRRVQIVVANDVTEREQSAELIRRLTLAVEQSPASVIITDTAGTIQYVNRKFSEVSGYDAAEVLGRNPRILQSGQTPREVYQRLWATITAGGEWHGELYNKKKNGDLFWEAASISPVRDAAGVITHYLAVKEDITQQKESREAVRENEERYRALADTTFDGIAITDGEKTLEVNRGMAAILGYSVEEMMRLSPLEFVAPESRQLAVHLLSGLEEGVFELGGLRKDGGRVRLQVVVRRVSHRGRPALLAAVRDVTAQRSLEDQFRQAQKMEAVGRLAGGVAHDFNNLLTVISSYSQLLLDDMTADDARREDLEEIRRAATSAAALTRQLLAFSRQQVLQPVVLDLNAVVTAAGKMLKRVIGEDIELVTALDPELHVVKADPGQIEQVLMNLAVNARDAMPRGGKLTIETANVVLDAEYTARHTMIPAGDYVLLALSDTGVGMDEDTKARLFEPFFTTKEKGKGTGLGLATVYGIVKQSGGYIWVYSELGQGATFKIYLPQLAARMEMARQRTTAGEMPRGTETVLLAEDAAPVRAVARLILERCGYSVLEAPNGKVALDLAAGRRETIDLLVTDVVMPEMSGRELADRLREQRPTIKVLYVSGYTDDAVVRHGILEPGNAYLQKPFAPDALARKVREVLDR